MLRPTSSFAALLLFFIAAPALAAHYDIFLAGGQSNAKPVWSDAIEQRLASSGRYKNVEVLTSFRSGHWLTEWYEHTDAAQPRRPDYLGDFYDPSAGVATAEARLAQIAAAGDTYAVHSLFWFQGEGDSGGSYAANTYEDRLSGMIESLAGDFRGDSSMPATVALVWGDEAYLDPSRPNFINTIRSAQQAVGEATGGGWVDTASYPRTDAYHVTSDGLIEIGHAMADVYLASIPEPSLLALALLGTAALLRRRKHASH